MVNAVNIKPILDPNYPAFMRGSALVDVYMKHANTMLSEKAGKQAYIKGQNGALVLVNLVDELVQKGAKPSIKSNQFLNFPDETTVDDIIARVILEVGSQVPGMYRMYQNQVVEQLKGLKPKYATTLEEAATALGVELNPE